VSRVRIASPPIAATGRKATPCITLARAHRMEALSSSVTDPSAWGALRCNLCPPHCEVPFRHFMEDEMKMLFVLVLLSLTASAPAFAGFGWQHGHGSTVNRYPPPSNSR
jgi:hypothetical protein